MTSHITMLFEEIFEMKSYYTRDELVVIVDFLKSEIRKEAVEIYRKKIGEITRSDVLLGKISYNSRHIMESLYKESIITEDIYSEFIELADDKFNKLIYTPTKDYEGELVRILEDVEGLIESLKSLE